MNVNCLLPEKYISSKIKLLYTIVDGLGNPVEFMLSAGNDHNSAHAVELLGKIEISGSNILADRAYGPKTIRTYIEESHHNDTIRTLHSPMSGTI